jgi:methionyl aminopeptidase
MAHCPPTLGYRGYTKSSCTSINHVVCHGIPDNKPLKDGDIVNVDVTYILDGWHGDSSACTRSATIKRAAERLLEVTHECLMRGIAAVKPGARTGAIGAAIQAYAEGERCSSCAISAAMASASCSTTRRTSCTTAIANEGVEMRPGMIFTIEPMINLGRPHVKVLSDGWTAVTRDRSLSAQYEHTVGVTDSGCEIFTLSPKKLDRPGLPA